MAVSTAATTPLVIEREKGYTLKEVMFTILGICLLVGSIILLVYVANVHTEKSQEQEKYIECLKFGRHYHHEHHN
uniref:Uncharacterized protein n=1 Tax=Ditylenchus dipsaci TaxID=166011 RepID=A0A915DQC9_9BILA